MGYFFEGNIFKRTILNSFSYDGIQQDFHHTKASIVKHVKNSYVYSITMHINPDIQKSLKYELDIDYAVSHLDLSFHAIVVLEIILFIE